MTRSTEDKLAERMARLLALARRGEHGEKENAQRMLERLLRKHGMGISDLVALEKKPYRFRVTSDQERVLLLQVICAVVDTDALVVAGKRRFEVRLSRGEYAEIVTTWDIYRTAWRREADRAVRAFIHRNDIFGESQRDEARPPLTLAEFREIQEVLARADLMDKVQIQRRLNPGGIE